MATAEFRMDSPDRSHLLMMGYLDAQLNDADRREFLARCEADPALAAEFAHYRKLAHVAHAVRMREPQDAQRQRLDRNILYRIARGLGAVTTLFSTVALVAAGILRTLGMETALLWPNCGFGLIGGISLFSGAELFAHRQMLKLDRYQGVSR